MIRRWFHKGYMLLTTALLLLSVTGCAIDDDRDVCCGNICMETKYLPYGVEELTTYIHSLRHFLFDANGAYMYEIPSGTDLHTLRFSLPSGQYTMLTIGNSEQMLAFRAEDHTLNSLVMELTDTTPSGKYLNADELYWDVCPMEVDETRRNSFVTYMNNIHSHLHVKVTWNNMPEDVGDYRMELQQVPIGYTLGPDGVYRVGDKIIPLNTDTLATYVRRTPLKAQEMQDEFITVRYTRDRIPVFRLWFGDKAVTSPIDLSRAFNTWGWNPEATAVQDYRIQLTLFANGTVEVRPWIDADVEDWQNGGTFS